LVTNQKAGAALAKVLGDRPVALMRGNGNAVVGSDIQQVVHRALYTEINAQQLATALSFRRPIRYVLPAEAQAPKRLNDCWEVWKAQAMGAA
jgi:HCOMODA/2-hydroxy-3-carboxy-muconic semialdehyde decarboxylase